MQLSYYFQSRACAKGKLPRKALGLLEEAKERELPLDSYIYTAVIDGKPLS